MSVFKYIAIEGPIGVGKSSLAKKLSKSFGSELLLEQPSENPFLEPFYNSQKQYALPVQLSFLMQRVEQLKELSQNLKINTGRIADFMIEKDPIFAELTLNDDEYELYRKVHQNVTSNVPVPDLVVYLQAPVDVLLTRIKKRNVEYELSIEPDYLTALSNAYTEFFHHYRDSPLLIVNAAEINFVDTPPHYDALVEHIGQINAGKHFFNPLV